MNKPTDQQLSSAYGLCQNQNCPTINEAVGCIAKCLSNKCLEWKKYELTGEPAKTQSKTKLKTKKKAKT